MADEMKSIVDKAIEESVNAFVRGVKLHDLTDPKTIIADKNRQLVENPRGCDSKISGEA